MNHKMNVFAKMNCNDMKGRNKIKMNKILYYENV